MRVAMIDVDNHKKLTAGEKVFPNLPLMKLSAWHKQQGNSVEWYDPAKHYDLCIKSKVFSFTEDYPDSEINADKIEQGGSGYAIHLVDGKEVYDQSKDGLLPYEVEHIYPDYALYGITDTAYGFCSRGCPRGCGFCHVAAKEGQCSRKVADLSEFWDGQKNIQLCDPNTLACREWRDILQQLIDSGATVDFNQGVDIRMMTAEKAEYIRQIKLKRIHFAFDRFQDLDIVVPRLTTFMQRSGLDRHKVSCYVLTNFDTTFEQDMQRVMLLRSLSIQPYIMRYDKEHLQRGCKLNSLARWCNAPMLFWKYSTFEDYLQYNRKPVNAPEQLSIWDNLNQTTA